MASPDPFESGKTLIIQKMSTVGAKSFLDANPGEGKSTSVYLNESMEFSKHPGCHWKCIQVDDGTYRLLTYPWSEDSNKCYLDSSASATRDASVYLEDKSAGGGSKWIPTKLPDRGYTLRSLTPSGSKQFMKANPLGRKEENVYLTEHSDSSYQSIDTHWIVGVDYHSQSDVERIVHKVYPHLTINFFEVNIKPFYASLDLWKLHAIWSNASVSTYHYKWYKFSSDDFAASLRAEVSKYSYNQSLPDDKGSICGTMWGRKSSDRAHVQAFNFIINSYEDLILFDPMTGGQIGHDEYVPYFCVL